MHVSGMQMCERERKLLQFLRHYAVYFELASFPGPTQFYKQWKMVWGLGTRPYWTNLTCHLYKVNQMPKRRYREPAFLPFQQQSVGQTPVGSFPPVLPVPCMDHPWGPVWNTPHLVPAKL